MACEVCVVGVWIGRGEGGTGAGDGAVVGADTCVLIVSAVEERES